MYKNDRIQAKSVWIWPENTRKKKKRYIPKNVWNKPKNSLSFPDRRPEGCLFMTATSSFLLAGPFLQSVRSAFSVSVLWKSNPMSAVRFDSAGKMQDFSHTSCSQIPSQHADKNPAIRASDHANIRTQSTRQISIQVGCIRKLQVCKTLHRLPCKIRHFLSQACIDPPADRNGSKMDLDPFLSWRWRQNTDVKSSPCSAPLCRLLM